MLKRLPLIRKITMKSLKRPAWSPRTSHHQAVWPDWIIVPIFLWNFSNYDFANKSYPSDNLYPSLSASIHVYLSRSESIRVDPSQSESIRVDQSQSESIRRSVSIRAATLQSHKLAVLERQWLLQESWEFEKIPRWFRVRIARASGSGSIRVDPS